MVEAGEIKGLNTHRAPVATGTMETGKLSGSLLGGSGPAAPGGSRISTLSMMIEDEKRKNGGKVGGSASLGGK